MAGKRRSTKATKRKKDYLTPDAVNRVSEAFNNAILLSRDWNPDQVRDRTLAAWGEIRPGLVKECNGRLVEEADERVQAMFDGSADQWLKDVNSVLDDYRRQSDVALSRAKRDILSLWHEIAYGEDRGAFDMPWLRHMTVAEKFAPFVEKDQRYVFKGFANQSLLTFAADHNDKNQEPVVMFRGELESILAHDFEPDPESKVDPKRQQRSFVIDKLRGISSMSSVFVPRIYERWVHENGRPWRAPDGEKRHPTHQEVDSEGLHKRELKTFVSQPVWSVSDVEHLLSNEQKEKLQALRDLRTPKAEAMINPQNEDLHEVIDSLIDQDIEQQAVSVGNHPERAFYMPSSDMMAIPEKVQFKNPVLRYAVFSHELAHSTKHLLGRKPDNKHGSVPYAQEEMLAETCAHLRVKTLEEKLEQINGGELPEQWQTYFKDYYDNAVIYAKGWGSAFDFKDCFDQILKADAMLKDKNLIQDMMSDVVSAVSLLQNAELDQQPITVDRRKEALSNNYGKWLEERPSGPAMV